MPIVHTATRKELHMYFLEHPFAIRGNPMSLETAAVKLLLEQQTLHHAHVHASEGE
jgi:hypothetical protein